MGNEEFLFPMEISIDNQVIRYALWKQRKPRYGQE